jgi:hypothetical protein
VPNAEYVNFPRCLASTVVGRGALFGAIEPACPALGESVIPPVCGRVEAPYEGGSVK